MGCGDFQPRGSPVGGLGIPLCRAHPGHRRLVDSEDPFPIEGLDFYVGYFTTDHDHGSSLEASTAVHTGTLCGIVDESGYGHISHLSLGVGTLGGCITSPGPAGYFVGRGCMDHFRRVEHDPPCLFPRPGQSRRRYLASDRLHIRLYLAGLLRLHHRLFSGT